MDLDQVLDPFDRRPLTQQSLSNSACGTLGTRHFDTIIARTVAHDSPITELNDVPLKSDP